MNDRDMNALLAQADSGDLVLFSGKGLVSGTIRLFTRSRWSHVGMVVRDPHGGEALLLESTSTDESADIALGRPVRGVQVVRLAEKLAAYDGAIALRKLELDVRPPGFDAELQEIADLWRYRGYKSFTATLALDMLSVNRRPQRVHRVFCSELVAEVYKRLGIMCRSVRSSRCVPGDFGLERLPHFTGGRLSAPIALKSP
ncbi:MAG: hypothetical protein ACLGHJ_06235 [Gammaproteobacteria bacterium]